MTSSFWQKKNTTASGDFRSDIRRYETCDIVVIGGGLVGIAVAHYLKKMGCDRLVVLEKEFVGYGASGRNAGFIHSGMSEPYSRLIVGMGPQGARDIMAATMENHELVADAVAEKKIECGYSRSGSLRLATSEVERQELEESAAQLVGDGFSAEYVGEIRGAMGRFLKGYLGGMRIPADGKIDPFAFVNGLAEGLDARQGCEVVKIARRNGSVELSGHNWKIKSEMAIIAVNGYAPLLDRYFENMIFPVRGQMLATRPLRNRVLGDSTYYANFGYDYFRQTEDDVILIGGLRHKFIKEEVGYEDIVNADLQEGLETYLAEKLRVPRFDVDCRWTGVMGNTVDGLPLVGSLPHNSSVLAAVGFNGHGFGLGMAVARDLARAVMKNEGSELLNRFSFKRFVR
jgi:gamma-glutamylputrescine oxidase